jgi:hypothetical protein
MPFGKFHSYRGVYYVPTTARLDSGAHMDVEPVLSAPAKNRAAAEHALAATIRRARRLSAPFTARRIHLLVPAPRATLAVQEG